MRTSLELAQVWRRHSGRVCERPSHGAAQSDAAARFSVLAIAELGDAGLPRLDTEPGAWRGRLTLTPFAPVAPETDLGTGVRRTLSFSGTARY